jgi:hypothetical protein
MAFWTSVNNSDPLRKFRFKIQFGEKSDDIIWWAKSVTQPSLDVSMSEYQLINHKIKYPGVVTWNDIDITIVDVGAKGLEYFNKLVKVGYNRSGGLDGIKKGQYDAQAFNIQKFNSEGEKQEEWDLINPFIKAIKYGDLDYSSDELLEITLTVAYDSATLS